MVVWDNGLQGILVLHRRGSWRRVTVFVLFSERKQPNSVACIVALCLCEAVDLGTVPHAAALSNATVFEETQRTKKSCC